MRMIINERAAYLIFPVSAEELAHSADELARLARGVEDTDLWRPITQAMIELERKLKGVTHEKGMKL